MCGCHRQTPWIPLQLPHSIRVLCCRAVGEAGRFSVVMVCEWHLRVCVCVCVTKASTIIIIMLAPFTMQCVAKPCYQFAMNKYIFGMEMGNKSELSKGSIIRSGWWNVVHWVRFMIWPAGTSVTERNAICSAFRMRAHRQAPTAQPSPGQRQLIVNFCRCRCRYFAYAPHEDRQHISCLFHHIHTCSDITAAAAAEISLKVQRLHSTFIASVLCSCITSVVCLPANGIWNTMLTATEMRLRLHQLWRTN